MAKGITMRKIGLAGGMTPESTVAYYEALIRGARKPGNDPLRNPEIIIYSLNLEELVARQRAGDRAAVVAYLAKVLESLRAAGAEVFGLTANTPHEYLADLQAATSLDLVSIIDATREHARELGMSRPLLLGTRITMEAAMYPAALSAIGAAVIVPRTEDREYLDHTIYNELAVGRVGDGVRARILGICRRHVTEGGADGVILGCTELPLVVSDEDLPVPVLDTTAIHASAILAAAGSS
jgi:aspartate racemase